MQGTVEHTCKVQGGFYVASMQCWAQLHTCIVASSTQVGCCFIHVLWHQCSVHTCIVASIHKLGAASFWRIDHPTNIAPNYQATHKNMLTFGWLDFDDMYLLQKYGQLINGCAIYDIYHI